MLGFSSFRSCSLLSPLVAQTLNNGVLVDPHDTEAIADALLKLVMDRKMWSDCRKNGLQNIHKYSWPNHCRQYLQKVSPGL
jgi:sucrose-phosphate synthase